MKDHITVRELAGKLGLDRGNLHKRLRRDGGKPVFAPVLTEGGPQRARWVPVSYAAQLMRLYETAKLNARAAAT